MKRSADFIGRVISVLAWEILIFLGGMGVIEFLIMVVD